MAPARVAPRLIGLLAAHFAATDHARVDRLRRMLRSVEAQTHRSPLLASWSADGPEAGGDDVQSRASAVFKEFEALGVVHAMPRLRGRRSQFEHYARLRGALDRHIRPGQPPWVFFTDDDDLWHPRRAEEFAAAAAARPDAEVLMSRMHISPGLAPRLPVSATPADVTRLQQSGQLRVSSSVDNPDGGGLFGGGATGEYFDLAMAYKVFDEFFRLHNDAVLANRFADIRFRTFALNWRGGLHRFMPQADGSGGDPPWMYFYDRPTEPYTTPAGEEDLPYLSEDLPDLDRIAGMRQTMDCVIFQLAPTEGAFQISERDFLQKLIGLMKNQGPATVAMALDRCKRHGIEVVPEGSGEAVPEAPWVWPPVGAFGG